MVGVALVGRWEGSFETVITLADDEKMNDNEKKRTTRTTSKATRRKEIRKGRRAPTPRSPPLGTHYMVSCRRRRGEGGGKCYTHLEHRGCRQEESFEQLKRFKRPRTHKC